MSSRFLQTVIFTLVVPLLTSGAAPVGGGRLSGSTDAYHYLTRARKLSKPPSEPLNFEKFVLPPTPTDTNVAAPSVVNTAASGELNLSIPAEPLLSSFSRGLTLIDKTYLDAYAILRESNTCSLFFGGPRFATVVLNALYPSVKSTLLESHIGIRMSGPFTVVTDARTSFRYRLFKHVMVNVAGPFYRNSDERHPGFFQKIGHYSANTREARATMLLHELGHLLTGANGRWLLPDDGNDQSQIKDNTATIMTACSKQIEALERNQ